MSAPLCRLSCGEELISMLNTLGFGRRAHTHRTLLDHLAGTAVLLENWNCHPSTIAVGLLHSAYRLAPPGGLDRFRTAVTCSAGEQIESDVYRYNFLNARLLTSAVSRATAAADAQFVVGVSERLECLVIGRATLASFAAVQVANALEQLPRVPEYYPFAQLQTLRPSARLAGGAVANALEKVIG